jgi:Protein of unknown function (DUF2628).
MADAVDELINQTGNYTRWRFQRHYLKMKASSSDWVFAFDVLPYATCPLWLAYHKAYIPLAVYTVAITCLFAFNDAAPAEREAATIIMLNVTHVVFAGYANSFVIRRYKRLAKQIADDRENISVVMKKARTSWINPILLIPVYLLLTNLMMAIIRAF